GQADEPDRAVSTSPTVVAEPAVAEESVAEGAVDSGAAEALAVGQGNVGQGNVVQMLSVVEGRQHFHIVMQLCRGGSLAEFLEKRRRGQVTTLAAAAAPAVVSPAAASPAAPSTAIPASGFTPCPLHSYQVARPSARVAAGGDRSPVGFLPADSGNASPSPPATGVASDAENSPHRWYQAATWESNSEEEGGENEGVEALEGTDSAGRDWWRRMRDEERLGESGRESERIEDEATEQEDVDSVASQLKADWVPRKALTGKGMEKSASTGELAQLAEAEAAAAASFAGRTNAGFSPATGAAGLSTSAGAESAGAGGGESSRAVVYGGMTEEGRRRQQEWEDEAAWIVYEIAAAVAYCHKRGILHRDIKPENVLLTQPPSSQLITTLASPRSPCTAAASSEGQKFPSAHVVGRSTSVGQSTPIKPSSEFLRKSPSFSILATAAGTHAADCGARGRPVAAESGRYQAASVGAAAAHPPHSGGAHTHGRMYGSVHGNAHGHRRSGSLASWLGRTSLRKKQQQQQKQEQEQEQEQHQQLMQQLDDGERSFKAGHTELSICTAAVAAALPLCTWLRLADFGLAEKLQPGQAATRGLVGSPAYVAPEVAAGLPVSFPADVWGIGICLYMVLSGGQLPFSGRRTRLLLLNIRRAQLPMGTAAWVSVSGEAKDVVRRLLAADPKHRPSAKEVLRMPWVLSPRSDESKEVNFDDAEEMPALSSFATTEASSSAGAAGGEVLDDQRDGDRESCDSRESTSAWSTAYTTWPSSLHSTSSSFIMSLKRGGGDLSSFILWSFLLLPVAPLILISLPFCLVMLTLLVIGATLAYTSFAGTCIGCATILSPFQRKLPEPKRIRLTDGRLLAWQEFGVPQGSTRHTLLVVHAPPLCRTAGFPGLSEAFFHQRSIRVISFDLPGTGFSDPLPLQATTTTASFASAVADDIKQLAQQLHVVPGLWIVGFGLGSPLAHAAAERLGQGLVAGLLLLGPPGVLNSGEGGDTNEEIRGRETGMHAGAEERLPGGQPEVVMSRQQAGGVWQLVQQSFRGQVASSVLRIVVPRILVQSVVALLRTSPAVLKWIVTATSLRPISPRVVSLICDGLLDALQQGDLPYLLNLLVLTLQPHNTQPCPTADNTFFSGPVYTYKVFDEPRSQNLLPEAMFEG
ncbi:unnamed protein product, partial [Closterium sp. NIES-54]